MKRLTALAVATCLAGPAAAQSVVVGAGYTDFGARSADDQAVFSFEYQHAPFHRADRLAIGLGGALSVHADGDTHLGLGIVGTYDLDRNWFIEASVMPGAYWESRAANDLGGDFQIRSLLGVGYTFDTGNRLSLAVTHISNASTDDSNPGADSLLLRYHIAF